MRMVTTTLLSLLLLVPQNVEAFLVTRGGRPAGGKSLSRTIRTRIHQSTKSSDDVSFSAESNTINLQI